MADDVEAIIRYAPVLFDVAVRSFLIFLVSLGTVYILGRMLGLLKSYRAKNVFAFIAMVGFSYWSVFIYDFSVTTKPSELYWKVAMYTSVSAIFYVLIGFDLYARFNSWSDKKFGGTPKKERRRKGDL